MRAHVYKFLIWTTVEQIGYDSPVELGVKMAFELTSKQGAVLITKHSTYREDAERERVFEIYTKKHYDSWVDFAREQGHGEDIKPVLVTGVDLTKEFATIAYSDNKTEMECEFSVGSSAAGSASLSAWGSWHTQGLVHTNCGPTDGCTGQKKKKRKNRGHTQRIQDTDEPSVPESVIPGGHNQCVFIRYYTIRKRRFIPVLLKAGAGPHQLPRGNPDEDDAEAAAMMVKISDFDAEFDYLAEANTDVTHNVPLVSPEDDPLVPLLMGFTQDDRDGFDIVAEFIFQVRASSQLHLVITNVSTEIQRELTVAASSRHSRPSPGASL